MAEPDEIVARASALLLGARPSCAAGACSSPAGGTREPIDAVRFVGNRSSGRMGVALAEEARRRGADVTLLAANLAVPPPAGVERRRDADRRRPRARGARAGRRRRRAHGRRGRRLPRREPHRGQAPEGRRARGRSSSSRRATSSRELGARRANGQVLVGFAADVGEHGLERARAEARQQEREPDRLQRRLTNGHRLRRDRERGRARRPRRRAPHREGIEGAVAAAVLDEVGRLLEEEHGQSHVSSGRGRLRRGARRSSGSPTTSRRVVHAPRETLRLVRPLPRQRGAPDHRGLPGRGEDDAREGARALGRLLVLAASSSRPTCSRRT